MRKQVERVERKKKLMVYFMGIVMISSVFGVIFFGFTSGSGKLKYNDFKFLNKGSYWSANVDGREARFTYFPADVEQIKVDDIIISRLKNTIEIDVTSDFNETNVEEIALAQYQMGIVLNNFDVFVRQGLSSENENNIPIITCNDSTNFIPVVYFKSGNETNVYMEDNCIVAESSRNEDFVAIKDRLLYGILGIIQ